MKYLSEFIDFLKNKKQKEILFHEISHEDYVLFFKYYKQDKFNKKDLDLFKKNKIKILSEHQAELHIKSLVYYIDKYEDEWYTIVLSGIGDEITQYVKCDSIEGVNQCINNLLKQSK